MLDGNILPSRMASLSPDYELWSKGDNEAGERIATLFAEASAVAYKQIDKTLIGKRFKKIFSEEELLGVAFNCDKIPKGMKCYIDRNSLAECRTTFADSDSVAYLSKEWMIFTQHMKTIAFIPILCMIETTKNDVRVGLLPKIVKTVKQSMTAVFDPPIPGFERDIAIFNGFIDRV